jgi:4-amino-4-deoxy-L-arabinose transferase-like glycosyltransferase
MISQVTTAMRGAGRSPGPSFSLREFGVPALLVGLWSLVLGWLALGLREIRLSDVPAFIERAAGLGFPPSPASLVDPFYPWGYPALLRLVVPLTGDYQRAVQLLSLLGGAAALAAVWIIARAGFDWPVALAATTLLAMSYDFNRVTLESATDLPALGALYLALAALAVYTRKPVAHWAGAAGAALGLGYLVRYPTILALPVALVFLLGLPRGSLRQRLRHGAVLLAAFLLASALQTVPTALAHGNPFWTRQDINVYFFTFSHDDWGRAWAEANAQANGVVDLLLRHPGAVAENFVRNFVHLGSVFQLFPTTLLAWAGALVLLSQRRDWAVGALLLALAGVYALALSLTSVFPRVVLPILPAMTLFGGYALIRIPELALRSLRSLRSHGRLAPNVGSRLERVRAGVLVLAVLVLVPVEARHFRALLRVAAPSHLTAVFEALRAEGVTGTSEVLSLDDAYCDLAAPLKTPYPRPWLAPESFRPQSMAAVEQLMRQRGMRYLVWNDRAAARFPALARPWPPQAGGAAAEAFTEVYRDPREPHAAVWRLRTTGD